jgi:hypothetical protein
MGEGIFTATGWRPIRRIHNTARIDEPAFIRDKSEFGSERRKLGHVEEADPSAVLVEILLRDHR